MPARTAPAGAAPGLSIVVPLHNEHASLARLHVQLAEVARELRATRSLGCEVVYVDDGSRDDTLVIAHGLPATTLDVQVVSLSRNFGKEAALLAGLDHARTRRHPVHRRRRSASDRADRDDGPPLAR